MNNFDEKFKQVMLYLVILIVVISFLGFFLLIIQAVNGNYSSCWLRYSKNNLNNLTSTVLTTTKSVTLAANSNYSSIGTIDSEGNYLTVQDQTKYGSWLNAGPISGTSVNLSINGTVSLCKSYVPAYDLQTGSSSGPSTPIAIPRVGDPSFLTVQFPANADTWRNVAQVFNGDQIKVFVNEPIDTSFSNYTAVTIKDPFTDLITVPTDCSPSIVSNISPLCGRASIYTKPFTYECTPASVITSCSSSSYQNKNIFGEVLHSGTAHWCPAMNQSVCSSTTGIDGNGNTVTWGTICREYFSSGGHHDGGNPTYTTIYTPKQRDPYAYAIDGSRTFMYGIAPTPTIPVSNLLQTRAVNCGLLADRNTVEPVSISRVANYKFWMTKGDGIMYQYAAASSSPTNYPSSPPPSQVTFNPNSSTALRAMSSTYTNSSGNSVVGNLLYGTNITAVESGQVVGLGTSPGKMLQFGYIYDPNAVGGANPANNTGGYILNIQHTKCQRTNGSFQDDSFAKRGQVLYYILPTNIEMNSVDISTLSTFQHGSLNFGTSAAAAISINQQQALQFGDQNLWLIVSNDPADYPDSTGQYQISFQTAKAVGAFTADVIMPLLAQTSKIIVNAGDAIFQNLTCNNGAQTKCLDFFKLIKSLLTLYIMIFGATFALGHTQLTQKTFLTHSIKVIFVAGLMNGGTYTFFSQYVFGSVITFTDTIIANFGGYSGANPFLFMDELLTKLFFNPITLFQILALISGGLTGIVMFVLTCLGIAILVVSYFQAIAIYMMAKFVLAFLLGIAPIFLVFMLFNSTRHLFENWIKMVFKFMMEPVIVIVGLAVFAKLFTVYMDKVLSYSVCYKCAIPFQIPSIIKNWIPFFPQFLLDQYLFCFNWFTPWGTDPRENMINLSLPDVVAMFLVGYMGYNYITMAQNISDALVNNGSSGGPSSIGAGDPTGGASMVQGAASVASFSSKAAFYGVSKTTQGLGKLETGIFGTRAITGAREGLKSTKRAFDAESVNFAHEVQEGVDQAFKAIKNSPSDLSSAIKGGFKDASDYASSSIQSHNQQSQDAATAEENKKAFSQLAGAGDTVGLVNELSGETKHSEQKLTPEGIEQKIAVSKAAKENKKAFSQLAGASDTDGLVSELNKEKENKKAFSKLAGAGGNSDFASDLAPNTKHSGPKLSAEQIEAMKEAAGTRKALKAHKESFAPVFAELKNQAANKNAFSQLPGAEDTDGLLSDLNKEKESKKAFSKLAGAGDNSDFASDLAPNTKQDAKLKVAESKIPLSTNKDDGGNV